jgi:hypothetical protein
MYLYNLDGTLLAFVPGPPVGTPEAPMAILFPVCGMAAAGGVVTVRRARSKKPAAS